MPLVSEDGQLNLSQKQSDTWHYLNDTVHSEVFMGGGAGSGKSAFGCVWQILRRICYRGTRGFIGRENFPALRDSTMKTFFEALYEMGYRSDVEYSYNAQEHTLNWFNGSETHFRYMQYMPSDPDFNRFGSTEYTDGFVDEAPEVIPRACQVLLSRMRYKHIEHGLTPKVLYTGNPGDHWIKHAFVCDDKGIPVKLEPHRAVVLATIRDNPDKLFADSYIQTLEMLDYYDRARLMDGDWTVGPVVERPFAFAFDRAKHIKSCKYIPGRIVYVSVDFNVEPFCATLWHHYSDLEGDHLHCFHEIGIKSGTIKEMCERIRAAVGDIVQLELTGDRGGAARRIGINSNLGMFDDLIRELRLSNRQVALPPNPPHLQSREDFNYVLRNHPDFRIDPSCTGLIMDCQVVEIDEKGSIIKGDRTKVTQRGDYVDTGRYMINSYLYKWLKGQRNMFQLRKTA